MVEVRFSKEFEKQLRKHCAKQEAKTIVEKLAQTQPTDGDYITRVGSILLKERKIKTFRFYFVQDSTRVEFLSEEELKKRILLFIAMSKKNNQQDAIDAIKEDLKDFKL